METEKVREKGWSRKPRGCVWDCPGVCVGGIFEITQRSAPGLRSPTDRSGTSSPRVKRETTLSIKCRESGMRIWSREEWGHWFKCRGGGGVSKNCAS